MYSKYFLELLSKSVEDTEKKKNNTVDFYLEGGELHKTPRSFDITPMGNFWGWFNICYKNSRKEETKEAKKPDTCSYYAKNIRWQSGDIRFFQKFNEPHILQFFLYNFVNKLSYYPPDYNYFYHMCHHEIINVNDKCKSDLLRTRINPSGVYDQFIYQNGSLIKKQLDKIKNVNLKVNLIERFRIQIYYVHDFYIKEYIEKIENVHNIFRKLLITSSNPQEEKENIDDFWTVINTGDLALYQRALSTINSTAADLYLIARSYKVMDNLKYIKDPTLARPLINVVYFGDFHIRNIDKFLKEKYDGKADYNSLYAIGSINTYKDFVNNTTHIPGNRCLELKKHVSLDNLLLRLKDRRNEFETTPKKK